MIGFRRDRREAVFLYVLKLHDGRDWPKADICSRTARIRFFGLMQTWLFEARMSANIFAAPTNRGARILPV